VRSSVHIFRRVRQAEQQIFDGSSAKTDAMKVPRAPGGRLNDAAYYAA